MKLGSTLAMVLMLLVALAHALRLLFRVNVTIGDYAVPAWASVGGIIVPLVIAALLWRERQAKVSG